MSIYAHGVEFLHRLPRVFNQGVRVGGVHVGGFAIGEDQQKLLVGFLVFQVVSGMAYGRFSL